MNESTIGNVAAVPIESDSGITDPKLQRNFDLAKSAIGLMQFKSDANQLQADIEVFDLIKQSVPKIGEVSFQNGNKFSIRTEQGTLNLTLPEGHYHTEANAHKGLLYVLFYELTHEKYRIPAERNSAFERFYKLLEFPRKQDVAAAQSQTVEEVISEVLQPLSRSELEAAAREGEREATASARPKIGGAEPNLKLLQALLIARYPQQADPRTIYPVFANNLSEALGKNREDDVVKILEDLMYAMYGRICKANPMSGEESRDDYNHARLNELSTHLALAFQGYFNIYERGIKGMRFPLMMKALRSIQKSSDRLNPSLKAFPWDSFMTKMDKMEISTEMYEEYCNKMSARSSRLALGSNSSTGLFLTHGAASGGSANVRLLGYDGAQNAGANQSQSITLDSDFVQDLSVMYGLGGKLISAIENSVNPLTVGDAESLIDLIPTNIFNSLDLAYQRQSDKSGPSPDLALQMFRCNEMEQYLLYIADTVARSKPVAEHLKKLGIARPASEFYLGQLINAYFTKHLKADPLKDEKQAVYKGLLSSLEQYKGLDGLSKHVAELQTVKTTEQVKVAREEKAQVSSVQHTISSLRAQSLAAGNPSALSVLGISANKDDLGISLLAFIRRLNYFKDIDASFQRVFDENIEEAKLQLLYLVSGTILLSPLTNKEIRVYKPDEGVVLVPKANAHKEIIEPFERAARKISALLHNDAYKDSFAKIEDEVSINNPEAFAKGAYQLLQSTLSMLTTGSGWQKGSFSSPINQLAALIKEDELMQLNAGASVDRGLLKRVRSLEGRDTLFAGVLTEVLGLLDNVGADRSAVARLRERLSSLSA